MEVDQNNIQQAPRNQNCNVCNDSPVSSLIRQPSNACYGYDENKISEISIYKQCRNIKDLPQRYNTQSDVTESKTYC